MKMLKVKFTRTLTLPRFTMKNGEVWMLRADRLKEDGFTLGGGFVATGDFVVIAEEGCQS